MAGSHTVDEMIAFLTTAGKKGWMKQNTASSLKVACERVLGDLEPEEKVDVARVDVAAAIQQFGNRNGKIAPQSLGAYASRVRSAIKQFTEYKANPAGWRTPTSRAARASSNGKPAPGKKTGRAGKVDKAGHGGDDQAHLEEASQEALGSSARGLSYPFPLRADVTMTFSNIPRDLRANEVDRITQFFKALAVGDHKA